MGALKIASNKTYGFKNWHPTLTEKNIAAKNMSSVETQFILSSRSRGYMLRVNKSITWFSYKTNSIPYMAQQPILGPGLPQKTPPFSSDFCQSISILLFLGPVMCPFGQLPSILSLVFPLALYYEILHYELFWGGGRGRIYSSSILIARPTYPSLLISTSSSTFRLLCKL
jgi:hypothetical protein